MNRVCWLLGALLLVVTAACGGGSEGTTPDTGGVADVPGDVAATDQAVTPDVVDGLDGVAPELLDSGMDVTPDGALEDLAPEDLGEPGPVTPAHEPEPLVVEKWLVTLVPDPNDDPIGDALEAGTFEMPVGPGYDANGIEWVERVPGENGEMGYAGYVLFYAAARFELEEDTGIIVRADRFTRVYANGRVQPGDPYKSRKHRIPIPGHAGTNVVVASAYQAVSDPEIELWTTPDELYFNPHDLTQPNPIVGDLTAQYLGVPVLNLTDRSLRQATARVVANEWFEATELPLPALPPAAVTQVPFHLVPVQAATEPEQKLAVRVRVESPVLDWSWEGEFELTAVAAGEPHMRTRWSQVDHSVQYYGVNPPSGEVPPEGYGLVLSLHGAGVQGLGQAKAYGQKEWAFIVAPTNRRRFGFDWEEWGRLDGLEALDHAMASYDVDPSRVYVSGHSMGGHGTWQFGVHLTDRFRVVGPSAGWSSFYSYGGSSKPTGAFARARASSDTLNYVGNLANRAVYMIHGDADDNVPISEGNKMAAAVEPIADEFHFHVEPGAGHWWNGDAAEGADCVDWPELWEWMEDRTLVDTELAFEYRTPSPWVNGVYSYVSIESQLDPYEDSVVTSTADGAAVALLTSNVRGMILDGAALLAAGATSLTVDGEAVVLTDGPIEWGELSGKNPQAQGPFNQVFHRPFCFVVGDDPDGVYDAYVAWLVSTWNIIGNGHACALPATKLTQEIRQAYNLIYVGVDRDSVPVPESIPFSWTDEAIVVDGTEVPDATLLFVFPEAGHLSAAMVTTASAKQMLFWYHPFSSRSGMPDYVGWTFGGAYTAGFFDADWSYDPALGTGP